MWNSFIRNIYWDLILGAFQAIVLLFQLYLLWDSHSFSVARKPFLQITMTMPCCCVSTLEGEQEAFDHASPAETKLKALRYVQYSTMQNTQFRTNCALNSLFSERSPEATPHERNMISEGLSPGVKWGQSQQSS